MSKKLDTSGVVNELRGNSAFFPSHQETPIAPAREAAPLVTGTLVHTTPATNEPPNVRTNEPPVHRRKVRHTFDIFADQLLSLRAMALAGQQASGTRVLLGDLVQEALDQLITGDQQQHRTGERTTEGSTHASNEPPFERTTERTIVRTDTTDEQYS